ncbi:MAG: hypothetical protein H6Q89_5645 [Myxococcaceae bacterium]|nr:hypothetical protein [Myxococcaceae bacterium]
MSLELQILLPAFLACLVLTGFLSYLGLHVLARGVIFVDIALAQIAALGTAVASLRGIEPRTTESWLWSLGFTFVGAGLFALTRGLRRRVPQEAFIGITYAAHDSWQGIAWDLAFYMSFGVVIASSVQMAGVLLVFSFLIVPAVFSALFTGRLGLRLAIAYLLGAVVSAAGLWSSFKFDLPTGAAVVVTFGVALLLGAIARTVLSARQRAPARAAVRTADP